MLTIRDLVERERDDVCEALLEHPKRHSPSGVSYWNGNVAALNWVLTKIDEVRGLTSKAKNDE